MISGLLLLECLCQPISQDTPVSGLQTNLLTRQKRIPPTGFLTPPEIQHFRHFPPMPGEAGSYSELPALLSTLLTVMAKRHL